jgi:hypothetical protein
MTDDKHELVRDILTQIERREARLLSWGVVDGGFTRSEIEDLARDFLEERGSEETPDELFRELLTRRVLFRFSIGAEPVYRTRMAETIRLLARLRQLFPKRAWRIAPTLVSDYRFALRPRTYPRRSISAGSFVNELETEVQLSVVQRQAMNALLNISEGEMRLAEFQARATRRMLLDLAQRTSRGMIVGAGTGTGKTLAFYLPALAYLASLVRSNSYWTKSVAIYPRNELLKDQLQDAFRQARKLDELLRKTVKRKLLIGAYFGPTPATSRDNHFGAQWVKRGTSYVCPYLFCTACGGELHWRAEDRKAERERLRCAECEYTVEEDEIVLTRDRMAKTPPDLLFTTTETLNRRLSDSASRHVFGIGAKQQPLILLLDEAHTYAGVHGAQVAYLLRRWRQALRAPLHICGLSATLEDAAEFFSTLIGLPTSAVEVILPHDEDMIEEGVEYQVALRGDPASGASLLSTTIQTVMLLRRALDSRTEPRSSGLYGTRAFVFTDDLDVTNRLFHDLQHVEGRTSWGTQQRGGVVLASLRAHAADDATERLRAGQSWLMAEEIHAPIGLGEPLVIGRTSSQDVGVDPDADVIVATASLEVGFNDPEVGAVVQHKAPMDAASFLQRKGRAGRDRRMRPWTVVVLSDYGRDRIAYQAYDQLFDPILRARSLPVGNRHVLRMQAVYAFMDWVAAQLGSSHAWGNVWRDFAAPAYKGSKWMVARQADEIALLRELLAGDTARETSLRTHLVAALQITQDEALAIMSEPPRALLTSVLPTLLRRLETGWRRLPVAAESGHEPHQASAPLPEFVPENLFSDLNLPEVTITTPGEFRNDAERTWSMGILQALRTFAPGRTSRRFGVRSGKATHWVAPPGWGGPGRPANGDQPALLPIVAASSETECLGEVQVEQEGTVEDLPCYRPWVIEPDEVPPHILASSNAFPLWRTQLGPAAEGRTLPVPEHGAWPDILFGATAYTHNQRTHVRVRRFALGADASVRTREGDNQEFTIRFVDSEAGDRAVALGFGMEVDGIVFRVAVPKSLHDLRTGGDSEKMRALRTAYFRHRVVQDPKLATLANVFQREWLQQIYLSALVAGSLESETDLPETNRKLAGEDLSSRMARVLDIIFQSVSTETETAGNEDETHGSDRQKVHEALRHLASDPAVVEILAEHACVLWEEQDAAWDTWITGRFKATLGGALLEAAYRICSQIEEGDILLDLDPGPRAPDTLPGEPGVEEIWLTESVLGGAGHIEALLREYVTDPRRFFYLVERALAPSDLEMVDVELTRFVDLLEEDSQLRDTVAAIRRVRTHQQLQRSTHELKRRLAEHGVMATHGVLNSLYARLLRPGSSPASDGLVRGLVRRWRALEAALGVEIDARIFAYLASSDEALDASLGHIDPAFRKELQWRFQVLYGLLWPRGSVIRSRTLKAYNPFTTLPDPERELLLDVLEAGEEVVQLSDPGWREAVTGILTRVGTARLKAALDEAPRVRQAIAHLAAIPLEIGFLHLYPQVQGVRRGADGITVELYLREAIQ